MALNFFSKIATFHCHYVAESFFGIKLKAIMSIIMVMITGVVEALIFLKYIFVA